MVTGFSESAHLDQWRDTWVVVVVDSLVFDWCSHLQGGLAPLPVVEDFDVVEQRWAGLVSVRECGPVEDYGFEGGEERLHQSVDALLSSIGVTGWRRGVVGFGDRP